jgi:hypothetical protein
MAYFAAKLVADCARIHWARWAFDGGKSITFSRFRALCGSAASGFGCAGWGFTCAAGRFGHRHHAATGCIEDEAAIVFVHGMAIALLFSL